MECDTVPQDEVSTHLNVRKAIYATGKSGAYEIVPSSGWEVEEEATRQAVAELERLANAAYDLVLVGEVAPLYFHMYNQRMDIDLLAAASGVWRWRLKRHLKPEVFVKLAPEIVAHYAEVLGLEASDAGVPAVTKLLSRKFKSFERQAQARQETFKGALTVQCDKEIPYRLLKRLIKSAGDAHFSDFKLMAFKLES